MPTFAPEEWNSTSFGRLVNISCFGGLTSIYLASRGAAIEEMPILKYVFYLTTIICGSSLIVYHQALPQIVGGVPSTRPNKALPGSLNCSRKGGQFSGQGESRDLRRDTNQRRAVNSYWIADKPDIHFSKLSCPKYRPAFMGAENDRRKRYKNTTLLVDKTTSGIV